MKKLNIGIVGLGRISSSTHLPILRCFPEVVIKSGAERNPERAKRIQSLFDIEKIYHDYMEMYTQEDLDGVYVCLPVSLHYEACKKALENGINVFCEKPMTISSAEAESLSNLAQEKKLVLMPGYKRRYAANFKKAKHLIEAGEIGNIIQIEASFMTPGPYISWDPKSDWYLDPQWHGVIYDTGCYLVDLVLYLVPSFPEKVLSIAHYGFKGYETPTNLSCSFEMNNGAVGSINMGWRASNDIFHIFVHGTAGSIGVSRDYFEYISPATDPADIIQNYLSNSMSMLREIVYKIKAKVRKRDFYQEDLEQTSYFLNALKGKPTQAMKGIEAVQAHRFMERIVLATKNS